jgi:hypothetical protein
MHGSKSHCDVDVPLTGQKKATKEKAGFSRFEIGSRVRVPLELLVAASCRRFLRGRCEELGVGGMLD